MEVIINGIKYVPECSVEPITDEKLNGCLGVLVEMIYFNQSHKMKGLAYQAIKELSPSLAKLDEDALWLKIKGSDE